MANNLEFTIGFRPILDGLNRAVSAIQGRLAVVRDFNRQLEAGAVSVNTLLSQAAGFVGGAKILGFFNDVVRSGVSFNATLEQSRLGIAAVLKQFDETGKFANFDDAIRTASGALDLLKEKAVTSPASFEALVQAFQGTVGPMTSAGIQLRDQVNLIVNMSQALAGLGIRSEQILQETRALITGNINADAAAAKILNITAEDIRLAREAGTLYEFLSGKIAAFAEAGARGARSLETLRSNFGDLLQQRAAAAMEPLNEGLKTLYERLQTLAGSQSFAVVLDAIAERAVQVVAGIASMVEWFATLGPTGQSVLQALVSGFGQAAIVLGSVLASGVLLRGVFQALLLVINPLRVAFVALAGVSFGGAVRDIQLFSRELGLLSTINLATWGQRTAAAISVVGAAFAGWQIGGFIGQLRIGELSIQGWVSRVILWFDHLGEKIGVAMYYAWTNIRIGLLEKLIAARVVIITWARDVAEAFNSIAPARLEINTDALDRSLVRANAELQNLTQERVSIFGMLGAKLREYVQTYLFAVEELKKTDSASTPEARAQAQVDQLHAELEAARKQAESAAQKKARENLQEKQALLSIENQILAAQAQGDQALVDSLTRERDRLRMRRELTDDKVKDAASEERTNQLIETRLNLEDEIRERSRLRQAQERSLAEELSRLARERSQVEANRLISAEDKQRRIVALLEEENRLIAERTALLEAQIRNGVDEQTEQQLRDRIDQLRNQAAQNAGSIEQQRPLDVREQIGADIVEITDAWGTKAQAVARLFTGPIKSALQVAHDGMQRLLGTTDYWTQKLGNVAGPIMGAVTSAIANMFTQWIAGRVKQAAVHMGLVKAEGATEVAAKTPGALLSSISSFGVAAAVGLAALVAVMASFATGGRVKGGEQIIRVNEEGEEFVLRAPAVARLGDDFLQRLNQGVVDLDALPDNVTRSLTVPATFEAARDEDERATMQPARSREDARVQPVFVGLINHGAEQRRFQKQEGAKIAYDFAQRRQRRA